MPRAPACRAQVSTLRDRLLKIGARVQPSVRRIVLHLPTILPLRSRWGQSLVLGARPG